VKHSAALVPKPRVNLTRFHGVFAPNSKFRVLVTPARRGIRIECQHTAGFEPPMDHYPVRIQKNRALPLKAEAAKVAACFSRCSWGIPASLEIPIDIGSSVRPSDGCVVRVGHT
jgi:hypothetical protein